MKNVLVRIAALLPILGLGGCTLPPMENILDIPAAWSLPIGENIELPDTKLSVRESDLSPQGWKLSGTRLVNIEPQKWLDESGQAVLTVECGHIRQWQRPGVNLESLRPLQGNPFLLPDPNQLVSSQTWFWAVTVSGDTPRVAQSRYLKEKTAGGYIITELWEIKDLNYSVRNRYEFNSEGSPLSVTQAIHPSLPQASMASAEGVPCE